MVTRKILKNCKYYSSPPHLKNTYIGKVYVAKNKLIQPHTTVNWIEPEGRLLCNITGRTCDLIALIVLNLCICMKNLDLPIPISC